MQSFLEVPHADKYSCEIDQWFADLSLKISVYLICISHWVEHGRHMNTYQGRRSSQGKIIPIKRHFASFGIISPLVGSAPPLISIHIRNQSPNCYICDNTYHTNTYSQHTIPKDMRKITSYLPIKSYQNYCLSLVCYKISQTSLHFSIQLYLQFL